MERGQFLSCFAHIQTGKILFTDSNPTGAGELVVECREEEGVKGLIADDSFVLEDVAEFESIEFKIFFKNPVAESWFEE